MYNYSIAIIKHDGGVWGDPEQNPPITYDCELIDRYDNENNPLNKSGKIIRDVVAIYKVDLSNPIDIDKLKKVRFPRINQAKDVLINNIGDGTLTITDDMTHL